MFVSSNLNINDDFPQKKKLESSEMNLVIEKFDQLTFGLTLQ